MSVLTDSLDKWLGANAPWLLVCLVVAAALLALGGLFMKPSERGGHKLLREIACVSKVYLLTRLAAAVIALGVFFGVGPEWVIGDDVGGSMMGLGQTLIALAVTCCFRWLQCPMTIGERNAWRRKCHRRPRCCAGLSGLRWSGLVNSVSGRHSSRLRP